TADECIERLGVEIPVELYVYASPSFNAMCVKPEEGRLFIMFSSSLLEGFEDSEFRFVMGHELGHHLYDHHSVPVGYFLKNRGTDPKLALQLSTWSRYAEISADRAGAHCANDLTGVARALFKLSSGLTGDLVQFDLDAFMEQVDDMQVADAEPGQGSSQSDWFMTHPFSPLRVKALKLYHESELVKDGGSSQEQLELGVQTLMGLMEPNYLEGRTPATEAMRRALFAAALTVANADGEVSEAEIEVFEKFFGDDKFSEKLNLEKLAETLPSRIENARELTGPGQRMQLLRDLVLVARADHEVSQAEHRVLSQVAEGLELGEEVLVQFLTGPLAPLD
ncbi:MAG: M48 family metallopeptidase, partial [Granulosicoccaceae bacterium]